MKYLKKYDIFLEEDEFDIKDTDAPDLKMSKEKMNSYKKWISEYSGNTSKIDNIYKNFKDPKQIESELEKLLGKSDDERNPFLVEYAHSSKLKNDIENIRKELLNDKLSLDDFQQELKMTKGEDETKLVSYKVSDIKNRISDKSKKIVDLQKNISDSEKALKDKMSKIDKEMKDNIKKISSEDQK